MSNITTRYPACLNLHKLSLSIVVGRWEEEQARPQPIDIYVKFFYPELPAVCLEDSSAVMCYNNLSDEINDFVQGKVFLHIEFLAMQIYNVIRANVQRQMGSAYDDVKIWVRVHKFNAPIPALTNGASFIYTDLPEGVALATE